MKQYLLFLFTFLALGCASSDVTSVTPPTAFKDVYYRFEKGSIVPNQYYLRVVNHSKIAISFDFSESANTLTLNNGETIPLAVRPVRIHNTIEPGMVLYPRQEGKLRFNIPSQDFKQAATLTFKGATMVNRMTALDFWVPDRELFVIYNVQTNEFALEDGEKIGKN